MDPGYVAWLKIHHPEFNVSGCSDSSSKKQSRVSDNAASTKSSDVLNELLVFPEPKKAASKQKSGINTRSICITESSVLSEMKLKKTKKELDAQLKLKKKEEREKKKLESERIKKEKAQRKQLKELQKRKKGKVSRKMNTTQNRPRAVPAEMIPLYVR